MAEGNLVKNQLIKVDEPIDEDSLLELNLLLNTQLNGLTIGEINLDMITRMKQQAGIHSEVVASVVDAVAEAIQPDEEDMPIYTSGATNIFNYPELADSARARELISAFEDKRELAEMIRETSAEDDGTEITAYIGTESPLANMKECSVVTAQYELGHGMKGTVAIVGPRRMDYKNVVENLRNLKAQLNTMFGSGDMVLEGPKEEPPAGQ